MSALARRNGWRGFDCGTRVHGGTEYRCDGMPRLMGCGASVVVARPWSKVGVKSSGWLVCYGKEPKPGKVGYFDRPEEWQDDYDVVLTFCPECRKVVEEEQDRTAAARAAQPDADGAP